eukprot:PhF_6_TR21638/c0_g1_i4/m.30799
MLLTMDYENEAKDPEKPPCDSLLWLADVLQATFLHKKRYWSQLRLGRDLLKLIDESKSASRPYCWNLSSKEFTSYLNEHGTNEAVCLRCGSWFDMTNTEPVQCVYHRRFYQYAYDSWFHNYWACCSRQSLSDPGCCKDITHRTLRGNQLLTSHQTVVDDCSLPGMEYFMFERFATE